ncbi:MAG: winged helix-turn-helix domain-containing protein [Acetobacter sp.]|nr:winged helix-turn-helix domain-containing protein [Acetobacter sp.]
MQRFLMVPTCISNLPLRKSEKMLLSDIAGFNKYYKTRELIAKDMDLTPNYVSKLLSNLERAGYIEQYSARGKKRCFRLTKMMKIKVMEDLEMPAKKRNKILAEYDDDNVLDLSNNCVVKNPDNVEKIPHKMEKSVEYVENIPHNNNKQYTKQITKQNTIFVESENINKQQNNVFDVSNIEEVDENIDNSSLSVLIYKLFRTYTPNTKKAVPTLTKRLKVISRFRQEFSASDLLTACRNLACMNALKFGEGPGAKKWRVTYSWLTHTDCLLDEAVYDKRINWLERAVNNEVEPDMTIVGVDAWNKWKAEHK